MSKRYDCQKRRSTKHARRSPAASRRRSRLPCASFRGRPRQGRLTPAPSRAAPIGSPRLPSCSRSRRHSALQGTWRMVMVRGATRWRTAGKQPWRSTAVYHDFGARPSPGAEIRLWEPTRSITWHLMPQPRTRPKSNRELSLMKSFSGHSQISLLTARGRLAKPVAQVE